MKNQKKQLIILLGILAVCVIGYCAAGAYAERKETADAEAEAEYEVLSFESSDVVQLEVNGSAGTLLLGYDGGAWTFLNDISAEMAAISETDETTAAAAGEDSGSDETEETGEESGSGEGAAAEADEEEADTGDEGTQNADTGSEAQYEVNSTTANTILGYLEEITSTYEITPEEELSAYGLEDPSMTVTVTMEDGTVYQLVFGDYNEMLGEYYFYVNDSDTLYTMSNYTYNILNKSDTDLADEIEEEEE